jgi:hypothetical protein
LVIKCAAPTVDDVEKILLLELNGVGDKFNTAAPPGPLKAYQNDFALSRAFVQKKVERAGRPRIRAAGRAHSVVAENLANSMAYKDG